MAEPLDNVRAGMTGRHEVVVTRELTVGAHVDGMPFVFGTPMMILAMEMASAAAAAPHLPARWVTVGSEVNVRHLAPTPVGRTVVATAQVLEVSVRCCSLSKRMTASTRSARGRTAAARSTWRPSPSASPPGSLTARRRGEVTLVASRSSLLATIAGNLLRGLQGKSDRWKSGEKSEQPMLERVQDGPAQTVALRASGAVEAQDVEAAINAAVGEAATGLVVIIAADFGDFAGLARGLATSALAHKSLVKLAVVVDPEQMDGATLNSFEASPVHIRQFARADESAALEWAAAARRGE